MADMKEEPLSNSPVPVTTDADIETARRSSIANTDKGRWERLWPVIACGAGLFSDGYLNNVSFGAKSRRD